MNGKEIRFYDLFGGVGGFRLGLERASHNQTVPFGSKRLQGHGKQNDECVRSRDSAQESGQLRGAGSGLDGQEASVHGGSAEAPPGGDSPSHGVGPIFRCVGYADFDKHAVQIYNQNFCEKHVPTDARKLDPGSLPDFELLCAGFPCQSFSMAGKRLGFQDTRGTLFFEIARIAEVKRPRILLLENVKGLLSHDEGRTFGTILTTLDELGYDCEWEVLNSKHFGVPQNRERVFVVGHLRGEPFREVFPLGQGPEVPVGAERSQGKVANALAGGGHSGGHQTEMTLIAWQNSDSGAIVKPESPSLRASGGTDIRKRPVVLALNERRTQEAKALRHEHLTKTGKDWAPFRGKELVPRETDDVTALQSSPTQEHLIYDDYNGAFTEEVGAVRPTFGNEAGGNGVKLVHFGYQGIEGEPREYEDDSPTIGTPSGGRHLPFATKGARIRRLTPVECERLQGFPDGWTSGVSDTQRYKMMGNAVTVNVIQAIGEAILAATEEPSAAEDGRGVG